ncbi:hypothetical protein BpHYR1_028371, partial [Brachionus plicatilis]
VKAEFLAFTLRVVNTNCGLSKRFINLFQNIKILIYFLVQLFLLFGRKQITFKNSTLFFIDLEIMENKRLMEESNIFLREIQIANEAKTDFDKLMSQNAKLELFYKKKLDETASKKESIKPKICQIVGNYRGNQLFEADFNPKIPESRKSSHSNELMDSTRLISAEIGANNHEEVDGLMVRKIRREIQEPRFETHLCKALSIQLEINESFLFGKKSWDEHY